MALYSLLKLTALCALFHEAAAVEPSCSAEPPPCSGDRSERSPLGVYTANNVQTPFHGKVTHVDLNFQKSDSDHDVTYTQNVVGCLFELNPPADPPKCIHKPGPLGPPMTFTGYFIDSTDNTGSVLIPVAKPTNIMEMAIDKIFGQGNIHWCPNENHFVVKIGSSPAPFCVLAQPDMVFAAVSPSAAASPAPPPAKRFDTYTECSAFANDNDNIENYCGYPRCDSTSDCPSPFPGVQGQCMCPGRDRTSCKQKVCKLSGQPFCVLKRPTTGPQYFSLYCN